MILADDNFATIVQAVREGRGIFSNIRKFLRYLLSSNMGEVLTVFLGVIGAGVIGLTAADGHGPAGALVLPLLATQILWINLITDSAPALALGMDPPSANTMRRPPRKLGDRETGGGLALPVWIEYMSHALRSLPVTTPEVPEGLVQQGSDWVFDEFAAGRGIRSVGLEDKMPEPPSDTERKSILDLFR